MGAYLPIVLVRGPCSFPEREGAGGFPAAQPWGASCTDKTLNICTVSDATMQMCQLPRLAVIWSQPWVTALCAVSYLWMCQTLWGGLNWALDVPGEGHVLPSCGDVITRSGFWAQQGNQSLGFWLRGLESC